MVAPQRRSGKRELLQHALSAMRTYSLATTWRTWLGTSTEQASLRQRMEAALSLQRTRTLKTACLAWLVPHGSSCLSWPWLPGLFLISGR